MLKKLVIIAALTFGLIVCAPYMVNAHAAEPAVHKAMPSIELYSASYCGECKRAKAYMKNKGIEFVDYDIENDIDKRREFYARGGVAIPLLFIHGKKMEGFDAQRLESLRARES